MTRDIVLETDLPFPLYKRGKVRDVYDLKDRLLIVSTDRISAFDVVLPNGVPHKGEALNRLSVYWFNKTRDIVQNHLLEVADPRTIVARKTRPIKIEFVVRGYLYGSLWKKYVDGETPALPSGLEKAERLSNPILTPTTKAEEGHDIDVQKDEILKQIGRETADEIEEICLKIYEKASKMAESNGIIIADTKMEFGFHRNELILIDELLTP
ncbi:MAG: phosphoribosylaminoimidazolesuccinocarboxamide synthase, partial [Candidatus Bathyarchaeota archaeon]|nr:phosphoribosylaminoimidazolesuccinocarboxamide synthase [Candidatus Bathyarchaeota archaeon]